MKFRHLPIIMAALFLLGTASGYAASQWGEFKGFNKVQMSVNNQVLSFDSGEVPPVVIQGTPMVPHSVLSESLQTIVDWDEKSMTLSVYKPNVHMFVARSVTGKEGKDGIDYTIRTPFGFVVQGDKFDFSVFVQVDQLKTDISGIKISIETPSGEEAVKPHEENLTGHKLESFWYPAPFHVSFDEVGDYKVKFSIKTDSASEYVTVSEKLIVSNQPKKK